MRYIYLVWADTENKEHKYKTALELMGDPSAEEVGRLICAELDAKYPTFAFEEITVERYDYYKRRGLVL